ncbi:PAS domain S-box protein [Spirulina subsalsa FACHB-351]|uniref:PAS domain S-box protein n=1 Tax=Spirulina subsalsa FACHB-351 TaxID=234711 RepID=A0ABT3L8I6_9CYAN|nr:adenylate/guanylate cyclase domain-containing protein [Spirulina subsalsa]MCW6037820.1 PAS domain S-box protein [Spirulina subsalsa FACHB-351]
MFKWLTTRKFRPQLPKIPLGVVLVVPFVLQISGAVGLTGWLALRNGQRAVNEVTRQLRQEATERIQQEVKDYIEAPYLVNRINGDLVDLGRLDVGDWQGLEAYFWRQLQAFPMVNAVRFNDRAGNYLGMERLPDGSFQVAIANSADTLEIYLLDSQGQRKTLLSSTSDYDRRYQAGYDEAVKAGKATWGGIYTHERSETLASTVNQPVYDQNGELLGVFSAEFLLSEISEFLRDLYVSPSGQAFIIEPSGFLVASSTLERPFLVTYGTTLRIRATGSSDRLIQSSAQYLQRQFDNLAAIQQVRQLDFSLEGERHFLQVTPLQHQQGIDWLIVVVVPEEDFMAQIHRNTRLTILLCLAALFGSIFLGIQTSRWISRPILRLLGASQAIAQGQLNQQIKSSRIRELNILSHAFNTMSQQLTDSFTILATSNEELERRVEQRTAKLAEAEAELRGLFAAMIELVIVKDIEGRYLKIASANPQLLYNPMDDLIGKTEWDIFPPEQAEQFVHYIQEAIRENKTLSVEYKLALKEEELDNNPLKNLWFAANISPISETTVVWVARDITQRKKLEQDLYQSQNFLDSIIENLPLALFVKDVSQRFRYVIWNHAAESLYGIPAKDALGQNSYSTVDAELAAEFEAEDWAVVNQRQLMIVDDEMIINVLNRKIRQRLLKVPLENQEGEVTHLLCMAEDITERKRAEETLQKNEAEFRHLVHNVNSAIVRWDASGVICFINQFGLEFFGYSEEELIGKNLVGTIVPDVDSSGRPIGKIMLNARYHPEQYLLYENENMRKNGERVWVTWANQPIYNEQGELLEFLSVATDTTERRLAEEALRNEQKRSERLLLNILPAAIAQKLKQNSGSIAQQFDDVTIIFADIVGFTPLSANMAPTELVSLLNQVFSLFDQYAEWHGLEKIKTVGDAYIAVAGLPVPKSDHAEAVVDFALDLQNAIATFHGHDGQSLNLRIGIHSGSVVAGVIGIKKFIYDLWGDTVNVASRMESQGQPGKIQVTEAIYERLKDKYLFECRGSLNVKGKGDMTTYWVLHRL